MNCAPVGTESPGRRSLTWSAALRSVGERELKSVRSTKAGTQPAITARIIRCTRRFIIGFPWVARCPCTIAAHTADRSDTANQPLDIGFPAMARLSRARVSCFPLPRSRLGRGWGGVFNNRSSSLSRRWSSSDRWSLIQGRIAWQEPERKDRPRHT
jgi:hypothetical protein